MRPRHRSAFAVLLGLLLVLLALAAACSRDVTSPPAPDINGAWVGCTDDNAVCMTLAMDGTFTTRVWGHGLVATHTGLTYRVTATGGFDNHDTGLVALAICPDTSGLAPDPLPDCYVLRGDVRVERIYGALYGNSIAERHIVLARPVVEP